MPASRNVDSAERFWESRAVIREKDAGGRELVPEPDRVSGRNLFEQSAGFVVSTTVGVFVEFPEVVEMKSDT